MDKFTGKTSFEQWFSQISSDFLEEQIENNQLDHYVKKLYTKRFLKLLFYAQINETESLRALSDHLFSENLQKETDLGSISFSQLGRRLNKIPTEFFRSLFLKLVMDYHYLYSGASFFVKKYLEVVQHILNIFMQH